MLVNKCSIYVLYRTVLTRRIHFKTNENTVSSSCWQIEDGIPCHYLQGSAVIFEYRMIWPPHTDCKSIIDREIEVNHVASHCCLSRRND